MGHFPLSLSAKPFIVVPYKCTEYYDNGNSWTIRDAKIGHQRIFAATIISGEENRERSKPFPRPGRYQSSMRPKYRSKPSIFWKKTGKAVLRPRNLSFSNVRDGNEHFIGLWVNRPGIRVGVLDENLWTKLVTRRISVVAADDMLVWYPLHARVWEISCNTWVANKSSAYWPTQTSHDDLWQPEVVSLIT